MWQAPRSDSPDHSVNVSQPTCNSNGREFKSAHVACAAIASQRVCAWAVFIAILLDATLPASLAAAQSPGWDHQPYRIRAVVGMDLPSGAAEQVCAELGVYLERRVIAAIGPLWSFDAELASGLMRRRILTDMESFNASPPADFPMEELDKLVLIGVSGSAEGYRVVAREYDSLVQRWSSSIRRDTRQANMLPELVFATLCRVVSPVVQFEVLADDEKHVTLRPRGDALLRSADGESWAKQGELFVPVFRRTTRSGKVVDDGIQAVPWTYLEVVEGDTPTTKALVHSGTRRPFGIRRQGRVEQLAIALRADPGKTVLKLHSRTNQKKPLVGYEIYTQKDPQSTDSLAPLGTTDRLGEIRLSPSDDRLRMILVKNGGRLLARFPVVPGAEPVLDAPLPDDDGRLAAEAVLSALREELIDVVARRNILMARARQKIKEKDYEGAQTLLSQINELPGRSQFNLEITTAARRHRSDDPQIQRRIDHLFEGTQAALTQYLDARPINELTNELREAKQQEGN